MLRCLPAHGCRLPANARLVLQGGCKSTTHECDGFPASKQMDSVSHIYSTRPTDRMARGIPFLWSADCFANETDGKKVCCGWEVGSLTPRWVLRPELIPAAHEAIPRVSQDERCLYHGHDQNTEQSV